jgi:hypothetical protein
LESEQESRTALSQFHPTNFSVEPPPPPDYLAGAVLQGLSRPVGYRLSWGVLKSIFFSVISFGLLPILSWTRGFRTFAIAEQQQLLHLAQWVRSNSAHPLARQLESDAVELRPRVLISWLSILIAVGMAVGMYFVIEPYRWYSGWDQLLAGTYGFGRRQAINNRFFPLPNSHRMFTLWVYGLGAAYLLHIVQVHLHAADVRRFVARFSEIAQAEGINRVKAAPLGTTLRPLWLAGGFALFAMGAPWGVVAMVAGAAQRRYITSTSRDTRADLAHRLRAMLMRRRPSVAMGGASVPVYLRDRCVEAKCRAELPRCVNYCPRCGTRQKAQVNRVA